MPLFFPDSLQANRGRFSHPNSPNVFALSIFRPKSTMISDFNESLSVLNFQFAQAHGTQRGLRLLNFEIVVQPGIVPLSALKLWL